MATSKMMQSLQATLSGLKDEHSTLGQAVEKMEELLVALTGGAVVTEGKRRGRPPGSGKKLARRGRPPGSGKKKRGRPPGSVNKVKAEGAGKKVVKKAGRRSWSPEQKKAASERMRAQWANRKD